MLESWVSRSLAALIHSLYLESCRELSLFEIESADHEQLQPGVPDAHAAVF